MLAATIVSLLVLAILNLAILPTFNVFNFSGARAGTNNCLLDNQNWRGSPLLVSLETCLPQLNVSRRVVKVLDSYCRVHHIRRPLYRLSKRGMTSLAVPGHDPPTDITIFMDISINPGPPAQDQSLLQVASTTETQTNLCIERSATLLSYSRNELLNIRHTQSHRSLISVLIESNVLRFRSAVLTLATLHRFDVCLAISLINVPLLTSVL